MISEALPHSDRENILEFLLSEFAVLFNASSSPLLGVASHVQLPIDNGDS